MSESVFEHLIGPGKEGALAFWKVPGTIALPLSEVLFTDDIKDKDKVLTFALPGGKVFLVKDEAGTSITLTPAYVIFNYDVNLQED